MPGYNHYPWCPCGWCSGGHGGGSSIVELLPRAGTRTTWDDGDFCRPTICPKCGSSVFFVRHNGGSVWFDELGPPWEKHACFDDAAPEARFRSALSDRSPTNVFGIVIETEVIEPGKKGRILVRCSDGTLIEDVFETARNLTSLVGSLVFIERPDDGSSIRLILHAWKRPLTRPTDGMRLTLDGVDYVWRGRWLSEHDNLVVPTHLYPRLTAAYRQYLDSQKEYV